MDEDKAPKSAPRTPKSGRSSSTKRETDGTVLPVTNPLDLWYLCQKVGYAEKFPLRNGKGHPMYQRTVTQWVRKDGQFFYWHFPYYGEVGFDMTHSPPRAIMSAKDPNRPSRMPLSRYESIIDRYSVLNSTKIGVEDALLTKDYLEDNLTPQDFERAGKLVQVARDELFGRTGRPDRAIRGLLRIPDVIRVKDWAINGAARYAQSNLAFVIEMKFPGDVMSPEQQEQYGLIAGTDTKLRMLQTSVCNVERSRRRAWLEEARKTEPVFKDVRVTGPSRTERAIALDGAVGEISLLINDIEEEQQKVRRILQPPPIPANVPQMRAVDPVAERQAEEQRRRARATLELSLVGPMAAAAAGTAVVGGATLLGGGAVLGEGATVVATQGGSKLIQFPVGRVVVGAAANAAIFEAAAAPSPGGGTGTAPPLPAYDIYAPRSLVFIDE